jgi:MSHA biogenesis protein MshE
MSLKKVKIGDLLLEAGVITEVQLKSALAFQKDNNCKLGDALIQLKFIDEVNLLKTLAKQLKYPFVEIKNFTLVPEKTRKLPERIARRFRVLLLEGEGEDYLVGMVDPTDVIAFDELSRLLGSNIRIAVMRESEILNTIDQIYRRTEDIASFAKELKEELRKDENTNLINEQIGSEETPVAKLLDSIFEDAVQMKASDVHIEPDVNCLRIRQRVDGVLHESIIPGSEISAALVLRIKLIANLNIAEKRLPQDGRFFITVKNRNIDIRISTMPVRQGEAVVMRLLDQSNGLLSFEALDIPESILERLKILIHKPNGMIVVTGPTGSGKTTTLYAVLNELNDVAKKMITIEDPVEYTLTRVNQIQVNPTIHLTFASVLRSVLRQDPDIIMVGEMRDEETVRIGLRAATTGHLVLSTLHTNDAISSAIRLIDMGADTYLVASALKGIVAQRLVRRICTECKVEYEPNDFQKKMLSQWLGQAVETTKFYQGAGCTHCTQSGYRGRIGVYEILEINELLADALREKNINAFGALVRQNPHFVPLSHFALQYAMQGITSLEEVIRVSSEFEA